MVKVWISFEKNIWVKVVDNLIKVCTMAELWKNISMQANEGKGLNELWDEIKSLTFRLWENYSYKRSCAGESWKQCLSIYIHSARQTEIRAVLLTAAKQPGALASSIRSVLYFFRRIQVHLICPATTSDILKSVLIFLPERSGNSQRPPAVYQVYIDAILLGTNYCNRAQYFKPLATQPIHRITEWLQCDNNSQRKCVYECKRSGACVSLEWNLCFCLAGRAASSSRLLPENLQIVGRIWIQNNAC